MSLSQTARLNVEVKRGTTVAELEQLLKDVPDDAIVTVESYAGDRPWDSGTQHINFSWTVGS